MNTELARTFLAVAATGSFVGAAERLHVTQSTVSSRIRTLEDEFGRRLFTRNKAGAVITDAGRRFQKHAVLLLRTVEQARHDVGLPRGVRASVVVGARIGLWDGLMLDWLGRVRRAAPEVSITAEIGFEADLMQGLIDGRIDLGAMYAPQRRPGLELMRLCEERLVLVSSDGAPVTPESYVHVDWGPEFHAQHGASYPDLPRPALSANIGWLALRHILAEGGSAYLPLRLAETAIAEGRLGIVAGSPEFLLPVWLVASTARDRSLLDPMIEALGEIAAREGWREATRP